MKLTELIGYDPRNGGSYAIGTHDIQGNRLTASANYTEADVNAFLEDLTRGADAREQHILLARAVVEPISQVVPYIEQFNIFYMSQNYGEREDNSIPVEDTVAIAWQTHQDATPLYVESGFSWTRPDFQTFDTAMRVPWAKLRKAGWNFFARQMMRATEALARKRDEVARNVFDAALLPSHIYSISGGALTKAAVDTFLRDQAGIGFPVNRILVNPATLMGMGNFTWGGTGFFIPPAEARQLLQTLYIMNYGGAEWYTNPFVLTNVLRFGGTPNQIGWHQTRGEVTPHSEVSMDEKADKHLIEDQEHAWYIGNAYTLGKLNINA